MRRIALLFVVALAIVAPPGECRVTASPAFAQDVVTPAPPAADPAGDDVLTRYLAAVSLRESGALDDAVAAMERVHALAPDDPDIALELARTYEADRLYGDAAAAYHEAGLVAPNRPDLALAEARFHLDHAFRVRDALPAAERAADLAPDDPEAIRLLDRARSAALLATS